MNKTARSAEKGGAMMKVWSGIKLIGKWGAILGAIYIGTTMLSDLDFETRVGWFLGALALAVAYVDGTQKDRIADLEFRIAALEHRYRR